MRRWLVAVCVVVVALGDGAAAAAALLGDATVPFSAESVVTVDGHSYPGIVFHSPGHQRHEQTIGGLSEVVILDSATARGWLVVPGLRIYVEFPFPNLLAMLGDRSLRRAAAGHEEVNGVRTTKYRIDHTVADGSHAEGFVWVSGDGILMRLDGRITRPGHGRPLRIGMELAHLRLGPQEPRLFELPSGLTKLPAEALEPLLGGTRPPRAQ